MARFPSILTDNCSIRSADVAIGSLQKNHSFKKQPFFLCVFRYLQLFRCARVVIDFQWRKPGHSHGSFRSYQSQAKVQSVGGLHRRFRQSNWEVDCQQQAIFIHLYLDLGEATFWPEITL